MTQYDAPGLKRNTHILPSQQNGFHGNMECHKSRAHPWRLGQKGNCPSVGKSLWLRMHEDGRKSIGILSMGEFGGRGVKWRGYGDEKVLQYS